MIVYRQNDDYEPLTWVGGRPVYVTTLIVALHVTTYILGALAVFIFKGEGAQWLSTLAFQSKAILERGAFWEWGTYFLVHRGEHPLFFGIEMLCLYFFGRDVEQYIGRYKYVLLYCLLIFIPPMVLTIFGLLIPTQLSGAWQIHFAVFLTFAKLYPGVQFFLRIPAIWFAMGLLVLSIAMQTYSQQWGGALALLITSSIVWLYLLNLRGEWPRLSAIGEHVGGAPEFTQMPPPPFPYDPMERIDPILDKITESGLESLSADEVERLEQARRELLRGDERRG